MNLKEYFNTIDLAEIDRYLLDKQEENIELEFKTVNHPDYNETNRKFDKEHISKVLSGFANSNGGVVIWGIKAKENKDGQDVAIEKKPIKQLTKFLNLLNRLESQAVTPPILGIEHVKIEISEDIGFVKTFIPKSENAPHMANYAENHYYKRSGDSFYRCEHYDIMDIIQRKKTPKLNVELKNEKIRKVGTINENTYEYKGIICLNNVGLASAKFPILYLKVKEPFNISDYGLNGNGTRDMKLVFGHDGFTKYIGGTEVVIHPDTLHEVEGISLNEIGKSKWLGDLTIQYKVIAEGMTLQSGVIVRTQEELINLPSF